jgi:hypothetical protein
VLKEDGRRENKAALSTTEDEEKQEGLTRLHNKMV